MKFKLAYTKMIFISLKQLLVTFLNLLCQNTFIRKIVNYEN